MQAVTRTSRLSDILFRSPELITVVNRFGISLGVGDTSLEDMAALKGIDADFLTAIINGYLGFRSPETPDLRSFPPALVIDYLSKTNAYYRESQLPNIERHFNSLLSSSLTQNSNLTLLRKFFLEMKQELLARIERDESFLFPRLRGELQADIPAEELAENDRLILDKLSDLVSFFIVHLRGDFDNNLCRAVVTAIFTLAKDIDQNNRIRSLMF